MIMVYAGERLGQPDDEGRMDLDGADDAEIIQAAIDWSAGRWPESDDGYVGVVWATRDGEMVGSAELSILAEGEIADD